MIDETFAQTDRPFNVNVFVHGPAVQDPEREAAWLAALEHVFAEFGAAPPSDLRVIYKSFSDDPEMLSLLVEKKPAVVSFHFGLPPAETITALKNAGIRLFATATSLAEAEAVEAAGLDAVIAQGIEAGGHRGVFDPLAADDGLGTFALTRLLSRKTGIPVIAAGGIMDGAGIAAARDLGAIAAQLGTAFIACPESSADDAYRAALKGQGAFHTRLTTAISGRPARALANRFTELAETRFAEPRHPTIPLPPTPERPFTLPPRPAARPVTVRNGRGKARRLRDPCPRQSLWQRSRVKCGSVKCRVSTIAVKNHGARLRFPSDSAHRERRCEMS